MTSNSDCEKSADPWKTAFPASGLVPMQICLSLHNCQQANVQSSDSARNNISHCVDTGGGLVNMHHDRSEE